MTTPTSTPSSAAAAWRGRGAAQPEALPRTLRRVRAAPAFDAVVTASVFDMYGLHARTSETRFDTAFACRFHTTRG